MLPSAGPAGVLALARTALQVLARVEARDDAATSEALRTQDKTGHVDASLRARCFHGAVLPAPAPQQEGGSCSAAALALSSTGAAGGEALLRCLLERVTLRSAALLAAWMAVGFVRLAAAAPPPCCRRTAATCQGTRPAPADSRQ